MLEVLVAAEGGVISAEELLERAWDENADPFTNAVRITVSALRKRLGEPWIIATVAGVGYRIDTAPDTGREGGDRGEGARFERSPQTHPQLRRIPHASRVSCSSPSCGCSSCATSRRGAQDPRLVQLRTAPTSCVPSAQGSDSAGGPAVLGLVGGWLLAGRMLAPLTRITNATRLVAAGIALPPDPVEGRNDEFRELADASTRCLRGSRHMSPSSRVRGQRLP